MYDQRSFHTFIKTSQSNFCTGGIYHPYNIIPYPYHMHIHRKIHTTLHTIPYNTYSYKHHTLPHTLYITYTQLVSPKHHVFHMHIPLQTPNTTHMTHHIYTHRHTSPYIPCTYTIHRTDTSYTHILTIHIHT